MRRLPEATAPPPPTPVTASHIAPGSICRVVLVWFITGLGAMWLSLSPARALDVEFNVGPVKRDILALYDSREEQTALDSRIYHFAEMPFNWLGFKLTYVDVNGPLPPPEQVSRYRGIVSWFIEPMASEAAERYLNWLDSATGAGLKLVVFAEVAPSAPARMDRVSARIHARIGLEPKPNQTISITHRIKATVNTPEMVGFERPLDKVLPDFWVMNAIDPRVTVHLSATGPGLPDQPAVLVATGPGGGYVGEQFSVLFDPNTDRTRWLLNPFLFLKLAIAPERLPVPDVTTLSGRRMYFSQIDGDGWNNVSQIEEYRQGQTLSSEVVLRNAIEPFPDLPVSVGVIAGDMQPALGGLLAGQAIARKIFALPQVEVASHTYTHPFEWKFFENYSRAKEEELIDKVRIADLPLFERLRRTTLAALGKPVALDLSSRYVAGSSDLPRTYLKEPFDLNKEVAGALSYSESLAPAGKRAKLYQWSGNCLPFEGAIAATRQAGVRNMNGGDSRLDAEFPSVFYVPPISKPVGNQRQIYSGNSNENTYTNDWTGPYYGYSLLSETVRNTETPRRLKPFNIYYHMYSGEKESALGALRQNLLLARSSPVTPVAASRYAAIADDFFQVTMFQIDPQSWTIQTRGELQTVRFDDADGVVIDPVRSIGVLGSTRHVSGAMYVALDPAVDVATVTLMPRPTEPAPDAKLPPTLVSSRWWFRDYVANGCGFSVTAEGYGSGDMVWQTTAGRRFEVTVERDSRSLAALAVAADQTGALQLNVQADAITPLKLRFDCSE